MRTETQHVEITNDRRVRQYDADRKIRGEETNIQHAEITRKRKTVEQSDNQSENTIQRVFQQRDHVMEHIYCMRRLQLPCGHYKQNKKN